MSLIQKLRVFVVRWGSPAKFIAKTIIGIAVPGSGPALDLIGKVLDCAHETAKDNLESLASREDLERIEKMFDCLLGDMESVVEQLSRLEHLPDVAHKTLRAALMTENRCFAAARAIEEQGKHLNVVRAELMRLAAGQEELFNLQQRFNCSLLDYIEEQRAFRVAPAQLDERLARIEQALGETRAGHHSQSETILAALSTVQPESAVVIIATAAVQVAGHQFARASTSLEHATRLRPADAKLAQMWRYTKLMLCVSCPKCKTTFSISPKEQGTKFNCTSCGQRLQAPTVPVNKTVLAAIEEPSAPPSFVDPGPAVQSKQDYPANAHFPPPGQQDAPQAIPIALHASPEVNPADRKITVRMLCPGTASKKFKTVCDPKEIRRAAMDALESIGLDVDSRSGEISGSIRHSCSFACNCLARGDVGMNKGKNEFLIDVNLSNTITALSILVAIFVFPFGLLMPIGGYIMAQNEGPRCLDNAFRSMKQDLRDE